MGYFHKNNMKKFNSKLIYFKTCVVVLDTAPVSESSEDYFAEERFLDLSKMPGKKINKILLANLLLHF